MMLFRCKYFFLIHSIMDHIRARYTHDFGSGRSNHLPMVQYSIYSLGCNDETVETLTSTYIRTNNLIEITDYSLLDDSLEGNLGRNEAIDIYIKSVLKWLERVSENDYKEINIDNEMSFEEMKS